MDYVLSTPKQIKPMKRKRVNHRMDCSCCGQLTKGRQWHNRDTGYGLCPDCAAIIAPKETPEQMERSYGVKGVHYCID